MNNRPGNSYTNANGPAYMFNPSQGYTGYAGHTLVPDQTYQGGTYPPPPQPVHPQYTGVYGQQSTNQQPAHHVNSFQQHSNNNANNVPGQPVYITPTPSASQQSSFQRPHVQQGNKDKMSTPKTATGNISSTKGRRPSRPNHTEEEGAEMEVADGNLKLELPVAGSTTEKPPDGGLAAWRIVAVCATLNACSSTCLLILNFNQKGLEDDIGEDETDTITSACLKIRLLAAPFAAIAIVLLDYRKVAIIGSILVSVGFFFSGFLNSDLSGLMGVLLGGIAGLGLTCWYLCAIIPILEYFEKRRFRALMLSTLGSIVASITVLIVYVELLKKGNQMDWKVSFWCMLVPGAVGLTVSFFLQPLKLTMNDSSGHTFMQRVLGVLDIKLFKDFMLYLVMLLYFCDQFGRGIPSSYMSAMMTDKSFSMITQLVQAFLIPVGMLIGLIAVFFWKSKELIATLLLWGTLDLLVGYLTLQIPAFDKFGWVAVYSLIFGITQAVVSSLLNNTVPDTFGVHNIRIVEGLLGFSAGLGEIVAPLSAEAAVNNGSDQYSNAFYLAAGMLLVAGVFALVARFILIRKMKNTAQISSTIDNDGNEADGDEPHNDDRNDNKRCGTNNRKQHKGDNSKGHDKDNFIEDIDITDME